MKDHKLLKIKINIEYEVVGDDIYIGNDIQKTGEGIFRANRNDILTEAMDNAVTIKVSEIKSKEDLPEGYTLRTLPWLDVPYGYKKSEATIGEILK